MERTATFLSNYTDTGEVDEIVHRIQEGEHRPVASLIGETSHKRCIRGGPRQLCNINDQRFTERAGLDKHADRLACDLPVRLIEHALYHMRLPAALRAKHKCHGIFGCGC